MRTLREYLTALSTDLQQHRPEQYVSTSDVINLVDSLTTGEEPAVLGLVLVSIPDALPGETRAEYADRLRAVTA